MSTPIISCVIGDPISQSLSPALHSACYEALKVQDTYRYVACRVTPDKLDDAIRGVRALGIRGVSVTLPHKEQVIPFLDVVSSEAAAIKAVNTVVNSDGKLTGYNTDIAGIRDPLQQRGITKQSRALVIGAGGAARAAVAALQELKADVTVSNRTEARGKELASFFSCSFRSFNELAQFEFDIVIQATSVSMHGKEIPLPAKILHPGVIAFDLVYSPLHTPFLKKATDAGARIIPGWEMFVAQAALQFELYTGLKAPVTVMKDFVLKKLL